MHGYNYYSEHEKMQDRYDSGKEREWFSLFGDDYHAVENACIYEQLLRCGYSHEQAMTFNEYGWIEDRYCKSRYCKTEMVAETKNAWCEIETYQLPNGKWVSGHHLSYPNGGSFCGCSIYEKQFDTEKQAKHGELVHIIKHFESRDWNDGREVLLPQLKKAAAGCLQMELF